MSRFAALLLLAAAACGRLGFDAHDDAGRTSNDTAPVDTLAGDAPVAGVSAPFVGAADSGTSNTSTATAMTTAFAGPQLLVAAVYWNAYQAKPVIVATGAAWTPTATVSSDGGPCGTAMAGTNLTLWVARVESTGVDAVTTMQPSSNTPFAISVAQYAWDSPTFTIVANPNAMAAQASNAMSTEITLPEPALVVAVFHDSQDGGAMEAGSGYTVRARNDDADEILVDAAPSLPAGDYQIGATLPTNDSDACWGVAAVAITR